MLFILRICLVIFMRFTFCERVTHILNILQIFSYTWLTFAHISNDSFVIHTSKQTSLHLADLKVLNSIARLNVAAAGTSIRIHCESVVINGTGKTVTTLKFPWENDTSYRVRFGLPRDNSEWYYWEQPGNWASRREPWPFGCSKRQSRLVKRD